MPQKQNPRRHWVKVDYHSQNKQKPETEEPIVTKITLRKSLDIYHRLLHDATLRLDLGKVNIGYNDNILGLQEMPVQQWVMIDHGGDIPMHHILYFVLQMHHGQRLILWDRRTKLDRLYGSGVTKPHQLLQCMLQSVPAPPTQADDNNEAPEEEKELTLHQPNAEHTSHSARSAHKDGLCKYYAAGYCYYGSHRCSSSHNADAINEFEQQWLEAKVSIDGNVLPLVSIPSTFSTQRITVQKFDYLLVLDLEGSEEIIELPCILIDLSTMREIGRFHRWVRPTQWSTPGYLSAQKISDAHYSNAQSTAVAWPTALQSLNGWLLSFGVVLDAQGVVSNSGQSKTFLPVCCGNWDVKTQIPKQCRICNIGVPAYCNQWMNIKDFALRLYPKVQPYQVKGMASLLRLLRMPLHGTHHLGMDDTYNIALIVIQFAMSHARFEATASKDAYGTVIYRNNQRRVSPWHTFTRYQQASRNMQP